MRSKNAFIALLVLGPIVLVLLYLDHRRKKNLARLTADGGIVAGTYRSGHPAIPHAIRNVVVLFDNNTARFFEQRMFLSRIFLAEIRLADITDVSAKSIVRTEAEVPDDTRYAASNAWLGELLVTMLYLPFRRKIKYTVPEIIVSWKQQDSSHAATFEFDVQRANDTAVAFAAAFMKRADDARS